MLLDLAEQMVQQTHNCVVGRIRNQLPDDEREALDALLNDRKYSYRIVANALAELGRKLGKDFTVSKDAVRNHALLECACHR